MTTRTTDMPGTVPGVWRSLEERAASPAFRGTPPDEFPDGATGWPPELDRRQFLRLMGASLALGGLVGCTRRGTEKIVPYVTPPETSLPGNPRFYATGMPVEGFVRGILVESNLGRPTKIEGNPDQSESLGATDATTQAAILSLYDPDRSQVPLRAGLRDTWQAFEADWALRRPKFAASRGRGMALLTEPTTSPTLLREIGRFLTEYPEARWYQHTALASYDVDGLQPDYALEKADVILSIGSDCLFRHPACLRYGRDFAKRRRVENGTVRASRFYALEATPSVTGSMADFRLAVSPSRTRVLLDVLARAIHGGSEPSQDGLSVGEALFLGSLVRDLRRHAPNVVCIAGSEQDADVQGWAAVANERLGALGGAFRWISSVRSDRNATAAGDLAMLAESIAGGAVDALFILGPNPSYTAPASLAFPGLLSKVAFSVHLGSHSDETAAACSWHLPEAHFLETWADLLAYDGTATILQPLIEPLYEGRSAQEVLQVLRQAPTASAYDAVRETWRERLLSGDFESQWAGWLRRGSIDGSAGRPAPTRSRPPAVFPMLARGGQEDGMTLVLAPDPNVLDGRWSNNAWLQELPKPLTHLVWDNAALICPAFASQHGIENGELLALSCGAGILEAAAWIMPGQAADCVTLSLGYGRTRAGEVGNARGFDAYRLRSATAMWTVPGLKVGRTGRRYSLVTTQHHFAMEGRDLVRVVSPDQAGVRMGTKERTSLYPAWKAGAHAWGMSIDLSTCLGCNACVIACQAENNIPVVGKDQVSRGREMHWIRIDRYFDGDPDAPRFLHQPVPCMHCEIAPCELVCPVGATVHSSEGLNEMVYNRCVGTRYCSNNCPYKVRRFNFLDYRSARESMVNLQKNPDVTVRERGVMEKCTYCVQRINAARIAADGENRPIRDGELRTACQQACPVEAIVFGDIADPGSKVSVRKSEPTDYALLGELNTRPRTTYLAKMRHGEPGPNA
jgi:MoCo/4Fe-4S cofactor protein with predicted Tat translocation signal